MAVYNDYPYSNMHELNLDWIIEKVVNAELEINDALEKINQALDKFQELSDKVDGMEDKVNQAVIDSRSALEKANDALSSLQSTREEIAVLARLVSMTSDRADQAIETANSADEKANQVMEDLRDVVEVQIPIISRVASSAMDTATEADAKADAADFKATTAQTKADTADAKAEQALNKMAIYKIGTEYQVAIYEDENEVKYPIIQKIIDIGALPNSGSKTVAHGIDKTNIMKVLDIHGTASQSNMNNTLPLPLATPNSDTTYNIYLAFGASNITITTGRDRSALSGQVTVTYIDNRAIT